MGLLYTKFYMDFGDDEWRQASADPLTFEALRDGVVLEVEDSSHRSHKLRFRKGGRIQSVRVTGRFRLVWDDGDVA